MKGLDEEKWWESIERLRKGKFPSAAGSQMDSPMIERGKGMDGANPLDPFSWAAAEAKMSQKGKRKKEMIDPKSFPISRLGQTQRRAQQ